MHTKNPTEAHSWGCRSLALAIFSFSLAFAGNVFAAGEVRIGGTGSALGAMRMVGDAFNKQHPEIKVVVLSSLGTSGAIKAVPKGQLDMGLSARPLSEEEGKLGALSVEYARTPLVFAVAPKSPIKALTLAQMADIYSGKTSEWAGGATIRPILRQAGDDTTRQLRAMSRDMDAGLTVAEQRPGLPFATTDQETADQAESIPGAIGVMTLSLILSEDRELRAVTIDGVDASVANARTGKYPHVKRCFVITRRDPSAETRLFMSFLESSAGREVLMRTGHWIP